MYKSTMKSYFPAFNYFKEDNKGKIPLYGPEIIIDWNYKENGNKDGRRKNFLFLEKSNKQNE